MIEMITNKELQSRQEKTSLEVFDIQNHRNEIVDQVDTLQKLTEVNSVGSLRVPGSPSAIKKTLLYQASSASLTRPIQPANYSPGKKVNVDTLINLKTQDAKVAPFANKLTLTDKHSKAVKSLQKLDSARDNDSADNESAGQLQLLQHNASQHSPMLSRTLKLKPGETSIVMQSTKNLVNTPDLRSRKVIASKLSPNSLQNADEQFASSSGHDSQQKMAIDLSVVSFLKPHIINDDTYQLAHKGISRQQILKTDAIKQIEQ